MTRRAFTCRSGPNRQKGGQPLVDLALVLSQLGNLILLRILVAELLSKR
jgi:hypothetical protein